MRPPRPGRWPKKNMPSVHEPTTTRSAALSACRSTAVMSHTVVWMPRRVSSRPMISAARTGVAGQALVDDDRGHGIFYYPASQTDEAQRGVLDVVLGDQHELGGVAERHDRVLAGDPGHAAAVAGVDQRREHALADPARAPGLVDDQHPPGGVGLPQEVLHRQRRQPAQVEDSGFEARRGEPAGHPQAQVEPVAAGHDREVSAVAVGPRPTDRRRGCRSTARRFVGRRASRRRPARGGRSCGTSAIGSRKTQTLPSMAAAATQVRNMAAASSGRAGDAITSPGMSRSTRDRVVVVEVAAEALLVAVAGDAHDQRVAVLTLGEELQRRGLAPQLVLGVVEVGQVLDLRHREEARDPGAERQCRGSTARRAPCRRPGLRRPASAGHG